MDKVYYVATPHERKRLTYQAGFAFPYILVETWHSEDRVWLVKSHIPLGNLSPAQVERTIEETITRYLDESFSEIR